MIVYVQWNFMPRIPVGNWVEDFVDFITDNFGGFFDVLQSVFTFLVDTFEVVLTLLPAQVMVIVFAAMHGFWRTGGLHSLPWRASC